jgi:DNA polymerase-4
MDAFFASIEQLDHPEWRGKPLLVGGAGRRGVVAAASYEARVFGCRSAQPMSVARRLCPHAIIAKGNFARYREVNHQIMAIFERYTPQIQPLSIDEAFLDVTLSIPLFGPAEEIAKKIRADIRRETGVTGSVGVAPNKFLAKLASDMDKPDGLTVLDETNIPRILPGLGIEKMWGVGPKTAERLRDIGVKTFGDLLTRPVEILKLRVGDDLEHWQKLARGEDERPVTADRDAKTIGHENTFGEDLQDPEDVRAVIMEECEAVAARLRRHGLTARSVTVKIRFGDFQTITRRCTLDRPTDVTLDLWHAARDLFNAWPFHPVRLIGVTAGHLSSEAEQMDLFPDANQQKQKKLDGVVDQINAKFGKGVVNRKLT